MVFIGLLTPSMFWTLFSCCYKERGMEQKTNITKKAEAVQAREKRLKAALKANMKRRKAQAKVRKASQDKE